LGFINVPYIIILLWLIGDDFAHQGENAGTLEWVN
jgi:hypothetical protein